MSAVRSVMKRVMRILVKTDLTSTHTHIIFTCFNTIICQFSPWQYSILWLHSILTLFPYNHFHTFEFQHHPKSVPCFITIKPEDHKNNTPQELTMFLLQRLIGHCC